MMGDFIGVAAKLVDFVFVSQDFFGRTGTNFMYLRVLINK
jgi:hypothetical protein